ncbi:hypothetical protein Celaphus_00016707 [Cervus elaphus hippelaphus]|uniref:Uncharacterized protein n=1 Tax=Cervus elaphus hippelaphus TaxID=46360 RepID=A0A212C3N9_CEREH|nr:hypothetical protein Celaphus_00016707 [Cervus elaphus hippelaphus]
MEETKTTGRRQTEKMAKGITTPDLHLSQRKLKKIQLQSSVLQASMLLSPLMLFSPGYLELYASNVSEKKAWARLLGRLNDGHVIIPARVGLPDLDFNINLHSKCQKLVERVHTCAHIYLVTENRDILNIKNNKRKRRTNNAELLNKCPVKAAPGPPRLELGDRHTWAAQPKWRWFPAGQQQPSRMRLQEVQHQLPRILDSILDFPGHPTVISEITSRAHGCKGFPANKCIAKSKFNDFPGYVHLLMLKLEGSQEFCSGPRTSPVAQLDKLAILTFLQQAEHTASCSSNLAYAVMFQTIPISHSVSHIKEENYNEYGHRRLICKQMFHMKNKGFQKLLRSRTAFCMLYFPIYYLNIKGSGFLEEDRVTELKPGRKENEMLIYCSVSCTVFPNNVSFFLFDDDLKLREKKQAVTDKAHQKCFYWFSEDIYLGKAVKMFSGAEMCCLNLHVDLSKVQNREVMSPQVIKTHMEQKNSISNYIANLHEMHIQHCLWMKFFTKGFRYNHIMEGRSRGVDRFKEEFRGFCHEPLSVIKSLQRTYKARKWFTPWILTAKMKGLYIKNIIKALIFFSHYFCSKKIWSLSGKLVMFYCYKNQHIPGKPRTKQLKTHDRATPIVKLSLSCNIGIQGNVDMLLDGHFKALSRLEKEHSLPNQRSAKFLGVICLIARVCVNFQTSQLYALTMEFWSIASDDLSLKYELSGLQQKQLRETGSSSKLKGDIYECKSRTALMNDHSSTEVTNMFLANWEKIAGKLEEQMEKQLAKPIAHPTQLPKPLKSLERFSFPLKMCNTISLHCMPNDEWFAQNEHFKLLKEMFPYSSDDVAMWDFKFSALPFVWKSAASEAATTKVTKIGSKLCVELNLAPGVMHIFQPLANRGKIFSRQKAQIQENMPSNIFNNQAFTSLLLIPLAKIDHMSNKDYIYGDGIATEKAKNRKSITLNKTTNARQNIGKIRVETKMMEKDRLEIEANKQFRTLHKQMYTQIFTLQFQVGIHNAKVTLTVIQRSVSFKALNLEKLSSFTLNKETLISHKEYRKFLKTTAMGTIWELKEKSTYVKLVLTFQIQSSLELTPVIGYPVERLHFRVRFLGDSWYQLSLASDLRRHAIGKLFLSSMSVHNVDESTEQDSKKYTQIGDGKKPKRESGNMQRTLNMKSKLEITSGMFNIQVSLLLQTKTLKEDTKASVSKDLGQKTLLNAVEKKQSFVSFSINSDAVDAWLPGICIAMTPSGKLESPGLEPEKQAALDFLVLSLLLQWTFDSFSNVSVEYTSSPKKTVFQILVSTNTKYTDENLGFHPERKKRKVSNISFSTPMKGLIITKQVFWDPYTSNNFGLADYLKLKPAFISHHMYDKKRSRTLSSEEQRNRTAETGLREYLQKCVNGNLKQKTSKFKYNRVKLETVKAKGPGKGTDEGKPMKTYIGVNGDCLRGKIMTSLKVGKQFKGIQFTRDGRGMLIPTISEVIPSNKNRTDIFSQPEEKTVNAISSTWSVPNYLIPVTFRIVFITCAHRNLRYLGYENSGLGSEIFIYKCDHMITEPLKHKILLPKVSTQKT